MQSHDGHNPAANMNEMELVVKRITDFEALWRTSKRLTQRGSDCSKVSTPHKTFTKTFIELAPRIKQGELEKVA